MGRDYSDEDRPSERDRARRHKKAKRHSRERSRERPAAVENGVERHSRREDKEPRRETTEESRRDSHREDHRGKERDRDKRHSREESRHRRSDSYDRRERKRRSGESDFEEARRDRKHRSGESELEDGARDRRGRQESEAERKERQEKEAADLEDEAAKRRQRVALWQEQRRAAQQAEEAEMRKREEAAEAWTLEDDMDNELGQVSGRAAAAQDLAEGSGEVDPLDAFMAENDRALGPEEEVDPLDAFMANEVAPAMRQDPLPLAAADAKAQVMVEDGEDIKPAAPAIQGQRRYQKPNRRRPAYYDSESSGDVDEESEESDDEEWVKNVTTGKLSKSERLGQVDHSKIDYPSFRRSFYMEPLELQRMSDRQLVELRQQLDDIKVRGVEIPKPLKNWNQAGLSGRIFDILKKNGFESPMPIQAQALPVIMSGRDCIGIAKTGSGKTLAFVLPMLRHIKAQPPIEQGDGPIGLVMAPTRELVVQIGRDIRKFAKTESFTCVVVYGGSKVASQITELKRGAEIVACTPGRMIDILVTSSGKITNLRRVTYLVLDEADRMFDMGFEPQITRIVSNIRPDRQTVMFSATFPRSVEVLAKQVLKAPVEIQVGGRSVVNKDITQYIEIRQPHERFMRLLELLGEWQEQGKVLVFVNSQEQCDKLFRDLLQVSYACLSLHGGKDQMDRESTIHDFKTDVCNLLIATSVAARGLDVKDLMVVINYDPPNHHEDYVHRVGRTGRAGRQGTAYTFICEDEEKYAPDLVKALQESGAAVPRDLLEISDSFNVKRKRGEAQAHGSGYGGSGFKFNSEEDELRNAERKAAAKEARRANGEIESDDEGDGDGFGAGAAVRPSQPQVTVADNPDMTPEGREAQQRARKLAETMAKAPAGWQPMMQGNAYLPNGELNPLVKAAQEAAMKLAMQHGIPSSAVPPAHRPNVPVGMHFEAEIEINDFPQHARWRITHRDTLAELNERTGAAVTTKGFFQPPGGSLPEGERKIYLHIEGPTEQHVKECKREIKRILEETTERAFRRGDAPSGHKYNI